MEASGKPAAAASAGSATEDPRDFWAPWIALAAVVTLVLVLIREGTSAIAMVLLAHLFRALAADDMPEQSPNSVMIDAPARDIDSATSPGDPNPLSRRP